ncbi:MAG: class I SAM-dependent methyltransferase [Hyphomicrobiaceae bacterium]|nr:class I SAM-dependent methyltransferase [Hyphomicrobiaceae bacterium]
MTAQCRFCGTPLGETLVDLGRHPISNAFPTAEEVANEARYPLVVKHCPACHLVQAAHDIPPEAMFTPSYVYFSSMSVSWVAHARRYAETMIERFGLGPASRVVEIASNDGYLLRHFLERGIPTLGVEPTDSTAEVAEGLGIPVERAYFGKTVAEALVARGLSADLMAANNVLAHVPDIADFVAGFATLLKPQGVATFEFPHLARLIEAVQFDTIYHEHYSYLSLTAVVGIFAKAGLRVFDVEKLPTHGGSLRVYATAIAAAHPTTSAVAAILAEEHAAGLDADTGYRGFGPRVDAAIRAFRAFLATARAEGKTVAGYGAAAKGNTFLNACGVTADDMICVADKAPSKQGRLLPGSHVPVVAPEALDAARPDYIVILPWNLETEIAAQLEHARAWGARFVVAIPTTRVF